jgi:hypothetical protein
MKVKIKKTSETVEEVEVSLPCYYKHQREDLVWECIIYGRIDEKIHTQVEIMGAWRGYIAQAETTICETNWDDCSRYLNEEYESTEEEFLAAKAKAMEILSRI